LFLPRLRKPARLVSLFQSRSRGAKIMVVRVATVAFEGVEARPVDVQVQISSGAVVFNVVGLADKAVAESRERVRAALVASGLALPAKRITVNLAPADMPRRGATTTCPSHSA
jgi:magnesium chelatase family protein